MKKPFITLLLLGVFLLISCTSEREKLIGVWKVSNVTISADSGIVSSADIQKAEEIQKSISFELFKDSTVNLIAGSSGLPGRWSFNENNSAIYILLDGSSSGDSILIGKYDHGVIIKNEEHAFGNMTSVFEKK